MAVGVRYRDDEFEAKCDYCLEWWPLTAEFWDTHHGFRRCYTCIKEQKAEYERRIRQDPEVRARHKAVSDANRAAKKAADPEYAKAAQHAWYVRNAERERAKRRARYAAQKAARGEQVRHYGPPVDLKAEHRRARKREWNRKNRAEARAA